MCNCRRLGAFVIQCPTPDSFLKTPLSNDYQRDIFVDGMSCFNQVTLPQVG